MHMRKIYLVNIITGFSNVFNLLKEPLMQDLKNSISRHFGSEIYILSLTMETAVALKQVSALYLVIVSQVI